MTRGEMMVVAAAVALATEAEAVCRAGVDDPRLSGLRTALEAYQRARDEHVYAPMREKRP